MLMLHAIWPKEDEQIRKEYCVFESVLFAITTRGQCTYWSHTCMHHKNTKLVDINGLFHPAVGSWGCRN